MDKSDHQGETDNGRQDTDDRPSPSIEQHHNDESAPPTGTTQQKHSHKWRFSWPSAQVWFDFFLVLFTGALVVTSYLQWHTLTRGDRPWVGLDRIAFIDYAPGMRMGVEVSMINAGKTPAHVTHHD